MGNCSGCNKELGIFEGYETSEGEFCKKCYPKRKEILKNIKQKEEIENKKTEKKEKEIDKYDDEIKSIIRSQDVELLKKLMKERGKKVGKEKKEELIKKVYLLRRLKIWGIIIIVLLTIISSIYNLNGSRYLFVPTLIIIFLGLYKIMKVILKKELLKLGIVKEKFID